MFAGLFRCSAMFWFEPRSAHEKGRAAENGAGANLYIRGISKVLPSRIVM
jgi:hypothetical protein